jgi:hypothetical protein
VSSVRENSVTALPRPAEAPETPPRGPRCHCGTPITHTPGKRRKIFCSDACKSQAKRVRKAAEKAAPTKKGRLGKETTEFRGGSAASASTAEADEQETARQDASRARKARRYAGRRALWRITGDSACKGCGRQLMDPETGVLVVQNAAGQSVVLGLLKCGRIWFCPVCSAVIRHRRAEEITLAVVEWIKRGGQCWMVTFTAKHAHTHRLADLMDALQGTRSKSAAEIKAVKARVDDAKAAAIAAVDAAKLAVEAARRDAPKGVKKRAMDAARADVAADVAAAQAAVDAAKAELAATRRQAGAYQRLITGGVWAGDQRKESAAAQEGIRGRVGFIGMIRATEITVGLVNGWHPHIHAIVFTGGTTEGERADKRITGSFTPDKSAIREWQDHWRQTWTSALTQINPDYKPSRKHGVDFKQLKTVKDALDLGKYVAKLQEGTQTINPANEVARADLKEGRHGNMTPFQVLYRIADILGGVSEEDADGKGTLEWCLGSWHEYERAASGRRAIEWTRFLRQMLGIEGDDSHEGDLDMLFADDVDGGEFRGGVAVTETGWNSVTRRALDYAAVTAVEGTDANTDPDAVTNRVREILAIADVAGEVRQLTAVQAAETYENQKANLARRREEAAVRRKREAEHDDQEHELDRAAVQERARRHLAHGWTNPGPDPA